MCVTPTTERSEPAAVSQDGRIEQYTADGRYIGLMMMSAAVRTLASVRTGLWVGLEDGTVHVLLPNPRR